MRQFDTQWENEVQNQFKILTITAKEKKRKIKPLQSADQLLPEEILMVELKKKWEILRL